MLKPILETLDGLDEPVKSLYAEADGKFVLQIDGIRDHPEVSALSNAYAAEKDKRQKLALERDDWKAKADALPSDFDPEAWEKAKEGKADEAKLVEMRKALEAERDAANERATKAEATARKSILERDMTDALTAAGVTNPLFTKAARGMIEPDVKLSDDGKAVVETDMGPVALGEHVKRWAAGEGKDFVTAPSGGGSKGGKGDGAGKQSDLVKAVPALADLPEK